LGANKPKGLNGIVKIGYGHLCLMEENLFITGTPSRRLFAKEAFHDQVTLVI
jgi:hypothetical protein